MPHWNAAGQEEWVCQKGAHICTGHSTWIDEKHPLFKLLGCRGNVCDRCMHKATDSIDEGPISLYEHCKRESGLTGQALHDYINRHYGHG